MAIHFLARIAFRTWSGVHDLFCKCLTLFFAFPLETHDLTIFVLDSRCPWVLLHAIDNQLLQPLIVPAVDWLWERQLFGEDKRNTNFIGLDVGIWGNDGSGCKIDTLAHHVHAEQAFFLLQDLFNTLVALWTSSCWWIIYQLVDSLL